MSKRGLESRNDVLGITAKSRVGVNSINRNLSIPNKGTYIVLETSYGYPVLTLLMFRKSRKNEVEPSYYVVKIWSDITGFFDESAYLSIKDSTVLGEFDDFEEAITFYEGLI